MQAQGFPTDSNYGSSYGNGVTENGMNVELVRNVAQRNALPPGSKLHEMIATQEDLSRARQDLLVERSKTRLAGEAVRIQRVVTGNVEGQFLNVLRDFYFSNAGNFPPSITEAYGEVIQERDRLGPIEDEYFEAERTLAASEWKFMQEEGKLYQFQLPDLLAQLDSSVPGSDIGTASRPSPLPEPGPLGDGSSLVREAPPPPPPASRPPPPPDPVILGETGILVHNAPPPPPPPPHVIFENFQEPVKLTALSFKQPPPRSKVQHVEDQYHSAVAELDNLRKEFDFLRPQQYEILEQEFGDRKSHLEASANRVRSQELYEQYSALLTKLSKSEVKVQRLRQMRMGPPELSSDFSRRMSDEWLLDYVKTNAMERKLYMNVLEEKGLPISDGDSLDEWSERYWLYDATSASSAEGHDAVETMGDGLQSLSSGDSGIVKPRHIHAASGKYVRPSTRTPLESHPYSELDKTFSEFQDYQQHPGRITHDIARDRTAGPYSDSETPFLSSTHLWRPGNLSASTGQTRSGALFHRRSKSTPVIFEERGAAQVGRHFHKRQYHSRELHC